MKYLLFTLALILGVGVNAQETTIVAKEKKEKGGDNAGAAR